MLSVARSSRVMRSVIVWLAFVPLWSYGARAQSPAKAAPTFVSGMAQVVPAFQDSSAWIRQDLWVETSFDSDHDGKKDRLHVDVTRPRQTETEGLKGPILSSARPYFAGTARGQ